MSASLTASAIFGSEMQNIQLQPGDIRNPYNNRASVFFSDDNLEERISSEEASRTIGTLTKYGLSAGALYLIKKSLENQKIQREARKYLELNFLGESIQGTSDDAIKVYGGGRVTLTNLALNAARMFEELSPFSILRTFQTSHILQPIASANGEFHFDMDLITKQRQYFIEMFDKYGTRALDTKDIVSGLTYRNGKIYDGENKVVVDNARILTSEFTGISKVHDESANYNRILRRYTTNQEDLSKRAVHEIFELGKNVSDGHAPMTFIAAKKGENINHKWISAAVGQAISQGFNIVNEPFGFLEETAGTLFNKENPLFKFINKYGRINPTASQDRSIIDLATGYVKHGGIKLGILGAGFYALDNAAKVFGQEDSGYDKGILEGLGTSAVNAKLAYNRTISDRFEEYTATQEYMAPGSTDLLKLAGFPLAGAMAGGTVSYFMRATPAILGNEGYKRVVSEASEKSDILTSRITQIVEETVVSDALGVGTRAKRYATRGALIGSLFALPFLPGALMGESSDKAEAEYLYGQDVAIRKNRLWFSSSTPIEGDGVKYFTKNWYQRLLAGNKDKILYGDGDTKDDLNPFVSPFDYLRNPYRLEEMHKHDMPYPVWGMDVSVGGWAGKIFEKTVGQIIKPDLINPELEKISGQDIPIEYQYNPESIKESGDLGLFRSGDISLSGSFQAPVNYSNKELSLINDDLLLPKRNYSYNPISESVNYTIAASFDFVGLKGWASSNFLSGLGVGKQDNTNQIARSGEATNTAKEIMSHNLGGLFGGADVLRRIVPMSTDVMYNRQNPLSNQVSTTWLPNGGSSHIDFSKGAFWDKVENGYDRLPGQGYEYYNPDLKGVNPEDYPDINKFEILSDVAFGSKEFYNANKKMTELYQSGEMSDADRAKFDDIYIQNQERSRKKVFHEYKTDDDVSGISLWGRVLGSVWEGTTHNAELPTERLTFFRPAGKLLHQRSAIEDYVKTQLSEGDVALWDKPYKHFVRPFVEDSYKILDGNHVPEYIQERRNVDDYFNALEYYKQMKIYRENAESNPGLANQAKRSAYKTTYGALASGLDNQNEVESAYAALSDNERAYFSSFVNAKPADREKIESIVDQNTARIYRALWRRKDAIDEGSDVSGVIEQEEQDLIRSNVSAFNAYRKSGSSGIGISFREYLQEQRAKQMIQEATGMPDEEFAGWDPRIDTKDIKLRALSVGGEDLKEYGFWRTDEERVRRNKAILEEDQVTTQIKAIMNTRARKEFHAYSALKQQMFDNGIAAHNIRFSNTGFGEQDINI